MAERGMKILARVHGWSRTSAMRQVLVEKLCDGDRPTLDHQLENTLATEVVEQFLVTMGMFPVGSIVELNNGSIAVVLAQNPNNVLKPKVMVLLDQQRQPLPKREIIEMRDLPADVTHSNALWIIQGHEHGAFGIDPLEIFE